MKKKKPCVRIRPVSRVRESLVIVSVSQIDKNFDILIHLHSICAQSRTFSNHMISFISRFRIFRWHYFFFFGFVQTLSHVNSRHTYTHASILSKCMTEWQTPWKKKSYAKFMVCHCAFNYLIILGYVVFFMICIKISNGLILYAELLHTVWLKSVIIKSNIIFLKPSHWRLQYGIWLNVFYWKKSCLWIV